MSAFRWPWNSREPASKVLGCDVSDRVVKLINEGKSHIADVPASAVAALVKEGLLEASTDPAKLSGMDAVSIAVPTPLAKTRDRTCRTSFPATDTVARNARPGQVIVLESTTYPGTTRELLNQRWRPAGSWSAGHLCAAMSAPRES